MAWAKDETAIKDQFAEACLRNGDDLFKAALEVFGPTNGGKALIYAEKWAFDPYILNKKKQLLAEKGDEAFLPSKTELARKALDVHDRAVFSEDKLKAIRLYAELMGFITKDGANLKLTAPVSVTISPTDAKL